MNTTEKLCLQWNDFKENVSFSFRELREDRDLSDVTLVCEDGKQVEAHKVVLVSSSPFFMDILKGNKHPHPLIYMRGLKSEDLSAIVDFLYFGEANVFQENLDSFLAIAEEFRLKGFAGNDKSDQAKRPIFEAKPTFENMPTKKEKAAEREPPSNLEYNAPAEPKRAVAVRNDSTSVDLQELDQQIKSMMTKTDVRLADGQGYIYSCNICGKRTYLKLMPSHIEVHHITGVAHTCDICGNVSRSRASLRMHKSARH